MEDNENKSKNKLAAFWSVKRNRIITCAVGGALVVGIVLAIALPLGLNQGNNQEDSSTSTHTHEFAKTWEHDETYHWHASTCGHDVVDGKAEHTFEDEVTAPTEDEKGYTTYTCTVCGYSYTGDEVPDLKTQRALYMIPVVDETNKTVKYGLYPQTHVSDTATIEALNALTDPESNGWYKYNDAYYAPKNAYPYGNYSFSDGTPIAIGSSYWFKCEPITWKILTSSNGTYSLLSSVVLDVTKYASASNNYENSAIREWLNTDFSATASFSNSPYIQTTEVDNSAETTRSSTNPYACGNTNDKIYLLSYKDYQYTNYGFASNSDRMCKSTDYALANNCASGYYWTRSPHEDLDNCASYVDTYGSNGYLVVSRTCCGVRPAITIKL